MNHQMKYQKLLYKITAAGLAILFLAGCSAPATTSPVTASTATPTIIASTATPTIIASTATPTAIPPTVTLALPTTNPVLENNIIKGRVIRSDTNEYIANVTIELRDVTLSSEDPKYVVATTTSDEQGYYTFTEVKPGSYEFGLNFIIEDASSWPCIGPNISLFNDGTWRGMMGQREDGAGVVVVSGGGFDMATDDAVERNIEFTCK